MERGMMRRMMRTRMMGEEEEDGEKDEGGEEEKPMPTKMKSTEAESNKVIEGSYSAEWQLLLPRTGEAFSIPPLTWELKRMFLSKIKNVPT